jgi:hypothetical protein
LFIFELIFGVIRIIKVTKKSNGDNNERNINLKFATLAAKFVTWPRKVPRRVHSLHRLGWAWQVTQPPRLNPRFLIPSPQSRPRRPRRIPIPVPPLCLPIRRRRRGARVRRDDGLLRRGCYAAELQVPRLLGAPPRRLHGVRAPAPSPLLLVTPSTCVLS